MVNSLSANQKLRIDTHTVNRDSSELCLDARKLGGMPGCSQSILANRLSCAQEKKGLTSSQVLLLYVHYPAAGAAADRFPRARWPYPLISGQPEKEEIKLFPLLTPPSVIRLPGIAARPEIKPPPPPPPSPVASTPCLALLFDASGPRRESEGGWRGCRRQNFSKRYFQTIN